MNQTTKTKTAIIEGKTLSLKDVVWASVQTAAERLKDHPSKTALVEFEVNGCKVECVIRAPE